MDNFNGLSVTWLGQGGFIMEKGSLRLVVDPYLSDSLRKDGMKRSFPPPVTVEELRPDIVCCTHDHPDHFDEETMIPIYEQYPNCMILGPESVARHCRQLGFNPGRIVTLRPHENAYTYNGVRIKAVPAFHSEIYAIGLALEWDQLRIYISGDTLFEDGLSESVYEAIESPDIMMICINGKLGNMDHNDAVKVVSELKPQVAIPMHYGLFPKNTTDPQPFIEKVNDLGIEAMLMEPGRTVIFPLDLRERQSEMLHNKEAVLI